MRIVVNGEPRDIPEGTTLRSLIDLLAPKGAATAAEVNKELVPRRSHEQTILKEGDSIEVVTLVGGG